MAESTDSPSNDQSSSVSTSAATAAAASAESAATAAVIAEHTTEAATQAAERAAESAAHVDAVVSEVAADVTHAATVTTEAAIETVAERIAEDIERENTWLAQRLVELETKMNQMISTMENQSLSTVTEVLAQIRLSLESLSSNLQQLLPPKKTETENGGAAQEVPKTPADNQRKKKYVRI